MDKNVILVVNPVSGGLDKTELIASVKSYTSKKDFHFELYETSGNDDIGKIRELYNQQLPQRIIVAGGDGTVKMVAEAMEQKDVILGIIPAGSANGLAVDLNLPKNIAESLEVAFANNIAALDMIAINGKKSLHLSDIGLNAELIKNYENSDTRGMWGYALQAFTTLKEQEAPFNVTIKTAEKNVECVARMVVIANSQKYGTGVTINPDGKMDDGKFELVILKNLDMVIFGQFISGNMPTNTDDVEVISTDKAAIKTNIPVSFQIDGEYIGPESELQVEILHGQMKVAIP